MRTEIRFLLAVVLMIDVLVVTNLMFPPVPLEEPVVPPGSDSAQVAQPGDTQELQVPAQGTEIAEAPEPVAQDPVIPGGTDPLAAEDPEGVAASKVLVSVRPSSNSRDPSLRSLTHRPATPGKHLSDLPTSFIFLYL